MPLKPATRLRLMLIISPSRLPHIGEGEAALAIGLFLFPGAAVRPVSVGA